MSAAANYFVRVGAEVRGPYGVEQLRELAEVGVVTPQSEAAVEQAGPWETLAAHPAREVIFPGRAQLGFKAAQFAVLNPKVAEEAAPVNVQAMIAAAEVPGKILKLTAGQAAVEPREPMPRAEAPLNEVEEMVRAVNEVNAKFAPPPPPRRRGGRAGG